MSPDLMTIECPCCTASFDAEAIAGEATCPECGAQFVVDGRMDQRKNRPKPCVQPSTQQEAQSPKEIPMPKPNTPPSPTQGTEERSESSSGEYAPLFGEVRFCNEGGVLKTVSCPTESDYWREMNAGAKWAASQPSRPLGVQGQRFQRSTAQQPDGGGASKEVER
jgi:hypothetical protein